MIPAGSIGNSIFAYIVGGAMALLWLSVIAVIFVRWLKQSLPRMMTMTAWDWAELSGWLLVIGSLTAFDSYLLFFR
jgi:hypothetical protein